MNWHTVLPVAIISSALFAGLIILFIPEKNNRLRNLVSGVAISVCLTLIVILGLGTYQGQVFAARLSFAPGVDIYLHVDALAMLFAALSGFLWSLTTLYAIGYLEHDKNRRLFFAFFSLCVGATLGLALAGNLLTFVIFYELLTLTTFPLVIHKRNPESMRAGRIYLTYTIIGGSFLLAGTVWLRSIAGPLDFTATGILSNIEGLDPLVLIVIFSLFIVGLGVKAALVPLHGWLPIAMAAPAPVSALLHAVAVVKAGAFGIIRVVYDVYGIEFSRELGLTAGLAVLASITIVYGSLRALWQTDIKKRLAYSTISQVSYIALGTAIAGPIATIGGMIHLVHQGLMKITLFFCAGVLDERLGIKRVEQLDGVGRKLPLTMAAFTIAALGMIGVPPVAGFVSKWYLGNGAIETGSYWVLVVLAVSSLLNAIYFLPLIYRAWFKVGDTNLTVRHHRGAWMLTLPPAVTALLSVLAGITANVSFSPLNWAKLIAAREYGADFSYEFLPQGIENLWVVLTPLLPLMIAPLVFFGKLTNAIIKGAWLTSVPALLLALFAAANENNVNWLFFGTQFGLDESNRHFLLLSGVLWTASLAYAVGYCRHYSHSAQFYFWALLAMSGNFGLVLASDIFSFITFYTLMSLAAYGLVIFTRSQQALAASVSFIYWAIAAELALFAGFALLNQWLMNTGNETLNYSGSLLLLIGFGIKLGVFGFHFWLPLAHPAAPIPASALLSGIMVKAGLIGILKYLSNMPEELGNGLIALGTIGTYYAVVQGLRQANAKSVLAYSTISQMGIVTTTLGVGVANSISWPVLTSVLALYCVHHGVTKGALFLSIGMVPGSNWRWWHWSVTAIPCLSMVGLPFTSAALAKNSVGDLLGSGWIASTVSFSVVGTSLLMMHFVATLRSQQTDKPQKDFSTRLSFGALVLMSPIVVWFLLPTHQAATLAVSGIGKTFAYLVIAILVYWAYTQLFEEPRKGTSLPSSPPLQFSLPGTAIHNWKASLPGFRFQAAAISTEKLRIPAFKPELTFGFLLIAIVIILFI